MKSLWRRGKKEEYAVAAAETLEEARMAAAEAAAIVAEDPVEVAAAVAKRRAEIAERVAEEASRRTETAADGIYRYAAIDFETANQFRGSPCAIGIVLSDGGTITRRERFLFRPPEEVDYFDDFNIRLHKITPEMVKDEPRYEEVLPLILSIIGDRPIVAHNAAFDAGVIRDACDISGIEYPPLEYICTLVLSRTILDLPSYSLPIVAEELDIPIEDHHNPLVDAEAAATILFLLSRREDTDITTLIRDKLRIGTMKPGSWEGCQKKPPRTSGGYRIEIPATNLEATGNLFYGKKVVLTGRLPYGITRQAAWDKIASLGGEPQKGVTRKTNFLVIGEWNPHTISPDGTSRKYKRAQELREEGQDIEVMTDFDFLALLEEAEKEAVGGTDNPPETPDNIF